MIRIDDVPESQIEQICMAIIRVASGIQVREEHEKSAACGKEKQRSIGG